MELLLISTLKVILVFAIVLGALSPLAGWAERRQSAMIQDRVGPNRASIGGFRAWGLFHPIADVIKLMTKEDFVPATRNRYLHTAAPMIAFWSAVVTFAVIPFGPWLQIANLDIGVLFIFGIASLGVYGATIAGWASNNKYSLLGALRASAMMLSYEVTLGLTVVGVLICFSTVGAQELVVAQAGPIWNWGIFKQPVAFVLFFVAAMAATKRAPFDLPEGESEIVAGYFLEYSGMKFVMFYMGEYIEMFLWSALATVLFFGGWQIPWVPFEGQTWYEFAGVAKFLAVLVAIAFLQMTVRWTLPRFRYDQVMDLGWKMLLPASIGNVVVTAVVIIATPAGGVLQRVALLVGNAVVVLVALAVAAAMKGENKIGVTTEALRTQRSEEAVH
ncbi:MAG: NADH-quinone oxidoreductase subunit NuoH [Deltaproteobacteria bacterium]|nr:NADH-quinone oxidoreductase subunit NuoH [Deltaproteobacteria bacterium]